MFSGCLKTFSSSRPRPAERSSLLVRHPAVALCHLHAQVWERSGRAAQPEPVFGHASAVQHRGPGERLAQLPQVWQIPNRLFGTLRSPFLCETWSPMGCGEGFPFSLQVRGHGTQVEFVSSVCRMRCRSWSSTCPASAKLPWWRRTFSPAGTRTWRAAASSVTTRCSPRRSTTTCTPTSLTSAPSPSSAPSSPWWDTTTSLWEFDFLGRRFPSFQGKPSSSWDYHNNAFYS